MYFVVCFAVLSHSFHTIQTSTSTDYVASNVNAKYVGNELIALLSDNIKNETKRIRDLRHKLKKIDNYVVDKDVYLEKIINETKRSQLNSTNFYYALEGKDVFRNWRNETKNLYLKLKEKMNRDDIFQILSRRGRRTIKKYARRMMVKEYLASKSQEKSLDEAVDKYLGEAPTDHHKFNTSKRFSSIWDPRGEIEDRLQKKDGRRLFRGERTSIRDYPFVVSVHLMGRFWCGGAIYWNDLVITSASCLQLMHNNRFFRENPKAVKVRIASNHSRIGGEVIDALEVYFHPGYNPKTLKNNIAIIRLRFHMKFDYHRIPKRIEISTEPLGIPFTAQVILLGWGVTKTSQKLAYEPIYLQSKKLPIYPNKLCEEVYGKKFITRTMFCAGTLLSGEGACDHDAGGPAVLNGKLVGIISFGPAICGFPDAPTVFTLVGAYTDWIETVNETMPGYYRGHKRTTRSTPDIFLQYYQTSTTPTTERPEVIIPPHLFKKITTTEWEMEPPTTKYFTFPFSFPEISTPPSPPTYLPPPTYPTPPSFPPFPPTYPSLPSFPSYPPTPPSLPSPPPPLPTFPSPPPQPPQLPPTPSTTLPSPPSYPPTQNRKLTFQFSPTSATNTETTTEISPPDYYYDLPPGAAERAKDFAIQPFPRAESGAEGMFIE